MTDLKIGLQTRSLGLPLRQAVEAAARLGADGIEVDARTELVPSQLSQTGLRQFRKLLADFRLQVSAVAFPTRRGYDAPDDLDRRLAATQAAMRLAYELGSSVVINLVGNVPSSADDPSFARLVEALTSLGNFGQRNGCRLAALPGRESPADLAQLLAALPEASVGVDFHPKSLIESGHSPIDALSELGQHVLHVHAVDAVRDSSTGRAVDVELGRGMADMPAILGQLTAQFEYCGWVTIACQSGADPLDAAENAIAFLRAL